MLCFSCAILVITGIASQLGTIANASTVAFCFLILVLLSAFFTELAVAVVTSVVAAMCFNYFFLPPIGKWSIAAFDDWIALFVFLLTAVAISRLTGSAHENAAKARILDKTAVQLKEFGLWLLSVPRNRITFLMIAEEAVRIFSLEYCSIHLHTGERWQHFSAGETGDLSKRVEESLKLSVDRPFAVELIDEASLGVRYTQIRKEMEPVLALVVKSNDLPVSGLNTMACMIGLVVPDILGDKDRIF